MKEIRINRKEPLPMEKVVREFLRSSKLSSGLNTRLVFEAWDKASGASRWTIRKYYRDGTLSVTLSSSTARSSLSSRREMIMLKMNQLLEEEPLFESDDPLVGKVREIILK